MSINLIPPELKGNDTMNALITANDAAEACFKLTSFLEDMEAQDTATAEQRESCRHIAVQAATVSFYSVNAATFLFMSTVTADMANKEKRPGAAQLNALQKNFLDSAAAAKQMLNDLATEANAFLDSMEQ